MRLLWGDYDPKTDMWARVELVRYLASEDSDMRTEAMRRLGIDGEGELLPYLRECLTHYHYRLTSAAADALVRMGDDSVLHHFIDVLGGFGPHGEAEGTMGHTGVRLLSDPWCVIFSAFCDGSVARNPWLTSTPSRSWRSLETSALFPGLIEAFAARDE